MANLKITELTAYTTPISTDVFPIVDVTTDATKKITLANLATAVNTSINAVTASSTFGTDNVMLRSDGTGRGSQSTGITVGDSNNISYTIADAANVDALTITQNDVTNNKKGIVVTNAGTNAAIYIDQNGATGFNAATSGGLIIENTGNSGVGLNVYSNHASATTPLVLLQTANAGFNKEILRIIQAGTGGAAANIRLDGPSPQIEWVETDQIGTDGSGKFETQVQGDIFFINGRNNADSAFENSVWFLRPDTTANMNGNVGIGVNPFGIEKLTIGETTGGAARIALKETTAPTADSGYGKIYVKSSDSSLYFMNDSGTEFNLAATATGDVVGPSSSVDNTLVRFDSTSGKLIQGGTLVVTDAGAITGATTLNGYYPAYSGSDAVVNSADADYTSLVTAASTSAGKSIYVSDGTYTPVSTVSITTSSTKFILSGGATIQSNGASITTLFAPSTTGLSRIEIHGGKLLQTNATAQGVAIDMSDMANSWLGNMRIEEYGTGIQMIDTVSTSFYNHVQDVQMYNCNNGVSLGGTQPNLNLWTNVRVRPKAGGAGTGWNLVDTRGNVFVMPNSEPSTAAGITGFHLDATTRDNLFLGMWAENNATGLLIDAGANNNVFIGGTITGNTTDITDNGTGTIMIGVNKTGTKVTRIPKLTDINGLEVLKFTETASAVNEITIANSATGNDPIISATGDDSNIGISLQGKGSGTYNLLGTSSQAATIRLYEDTDDGTNYTSIKVGTQAGNIDYTLPTAAPTVSGQVLSATTAGVMSWASKFFTMEFAHQTSSPADAQTYYFGFPYDVSMVNTTAARRQKVVPFASTLRGAAITIITTAGATTEAATYYARINNTTDVQLSNAVTFDQALQTFYVTGLTQAIAAGDKIEIKVTTPTWVTDPTTVRSSVTLFFD